MCDNDDTGIWPAAFCEYFCYELKSIEIESGIDLIEYDIGRLQEF